MNTKGMRRGWLWYDNDPSSTLEAKVLNAAEQYRKKFGLYPSACYVHPDAIEGSELQCGTIRVVAARHILLHHFWLGKEEA